MKFYITEETQQELKKKIKNLYNSLQTSESLGDSTRAGIEAYELVIYNEILKNTIVLPVENHKSRLGIACKNSDTPNGIIIEDQP